MSKLLENIDPSKIEFPKDFKSAKTMVDKTMVIFKDSMKIEDAREVVDFYIETFILKFHRHQKLAKIVKTFGRKKLVNIIIDYIYNSVDNKFSKLSEKQILAVIWRYFFGGDFESMGDMLNITNIRCGQIATSAVKILCKK